MHIGDDDNPYLYVVMGYPERVASGAARQLLRRNLLLMGLVVLTAVGVVMLLGTVTFGRRFDRLVTTAGLIQDGDLTARTGIPTDRTELSRLAGAIDEMVANLEERNREKIAEEQRLTRTLQESGKPNPTEIHVHAVDVAAPLGAVIPLALIANELIMNAIKHGLREDGRTIIDIVLARDASELVLHVIDSGPGFPPDFDAEKSTGLGLVLVTALSKQLGGFVETGSGSDFREVTIDRVAEGARVTVRVAAERVLGDGRAYSSPRP